MTKENSSVVQFRKTETPAILSREEAILFKRTLSNQYGQQVTDEDLKVFLVVCARKRLDPLQKQIFIVPRYDNKNNRWVMSHQTSIDGYRAIAARTGQYAGSDDAIFDSELQPKKATVTVYRLIGGVRCPFTASARWDQFYPGDKLGFQWRKMPHVMLGKCAEAQALRKAFPEDLSGLETDVEMAQADAEAVTVTRSTPKPTGTPLPGTIVDRGANKQADEAEIEQMDAHVAGIAQEVAAPPAQEKPAEPSLADRRTEILGALVGKGPFGKRVGDAKRWVQSVVGADIMTLTAEQCDRIQESINFNEHVDAAKQLDLIK